ncbi:MAG: Slp family lipoprotein [Nitrospirota bacterium]|nr:Slp family lipoprotein [Nitrospirota bacterium]
MMLGKLLQTIVMFGIAAVLAACASSSETLEEAQSGPQAPPFAQIKATPDSFRGQTLVLGGQVLAARRMKEGTRIEVLQLPLNDSQQPTLDLMQSQGRFVAIQREFLDPATLPHGTFVTITGDVTGSMTLPLDETDYSYPVVDVKNLRTWTPSQQDSNQWRGRPYPYYSPFGHPYWGAYGRAFPYYW